MSQQATKMQQPFLFLLMLDHVGCRKFWGNENALIQLKNPNLSFDIADLPLYIGQGQQQQLHINVGIYNFETQK